MQRLCRFLHSARAGSHAPRESVCGSQKTPCALRERAEGVRVFTASGVARIGRRWDRVGTDCGVPGEAGPETKRLLGFS